MKRKKLKKTSPPKQEKGGSPSAASTSGGIKYDSGKPALDLIPYEALEGLGQVLAFGASKYSKGNWSNGIHYSRLIAAAMRHLGKFANGIDIDEESELHHLDHTMCNLAFLKWMYINRKDLDDRWSKGDKE